LKTRLYISGLIVLLVGLCSAILIYVTAGDDSNSAAIDEIVSSKQYIHELQRFGGKAAVLFDEFSRWFAALWHGKALAFTVAWISTVVSLGIFLFAMHLEDHEP